MPEKGPSQKDRNKPGAGKDPAKPSGPTGGSAPAANKSGSGAGSGASGRRPNVELPSELADLQKSEAEKRRQDPGAQPKAKPAPGQAAKAGGKEITLDDLKRFVRGEITLAQLEGITRDQLYDFAELGYNMFKTGKLDEACKIFEGLVTYNPYDAYFHSALGAIYQKQRRFDDALRQYDLALKFNSKDTCSLTNRGETFLLLGRLEEAAENFKKAIEFDPDEKDPWSMRARALVLAVNNALKNKGK